MRQNAFVFPGLSTGRPLTSMALLLLLRRMKRGDITVHGFRSSFRDWAAETTSFPNFVVEMALAHAIGGGVEAAYRRGDLFEKRRKLMDAWAAYIEKPRGIVVLGDFRGSRQTSETKALTSAVSFLLARIRAMLGCGTFASGPSKKVAADFAACGA